jgi:ketosteroid isomerase-like protein
MRKIICIIFFIAFTLGCSKKEKLLTEQEVYAVINKFDEGWRNKNAELVDSVLSEKYLYFTQSGHIFTRPNIISTAGSDIYELQTMERENLTMQIEGDAAVVNTIWKGKGYYHGEQFNDKQRCSITIVKHDGQVKILAEHCTPIK